MGRDSVAGSEMSRCASPPVAGTVQISPPEAKAISWPSGERDGSASDGCGARALCGWAKAVGMASERAAEDGLHGSRFSFADQHTARLLPTRSRQVPLRRQEAETERDKGPERRIGITCRARLDCCFGGDAGSAGRLPGFDDGEFGEALGLGRIHPRGIAED